MMYPAKNAYYGSTAELYDSVRFAGLKGRWLDRKEKRSVTNALRAVAEDARILDLPCGTGRITEHILSLGYRVAGGDISEQMIALAKRRIGRHEGLIGFHKLDGERIALPTGSYDCVTCVRLMGHLPPPIKANVLREMARVSKKYLVVTFYSAGPLRSLKWFITHGSLMYRAPWYPVTAADLRELWSLCGLTPVGHWHVWPVLSDAVTYLLRVGPN